MFFSFLILCSSCLNLDDYGATVGDCDELCTVYNVCKSEMKEKFGLRNSDFPDRKTRLTHVEEVGEGGEEYRVRSWYHEINELGDTTIVDFDCLVKYDIQSMRYDVDQLKTTPRKN